MNICLTLALLLTGNSEVLASGDHQRELTVDGLDRNYLVHVPARAEPRTGWPVVLIFHGGGSNAQAMVRYCGMNDKADQAGFVAVYPNGTGRTLRVLTFNGGNCCGRAMQEEVDDVKFVRALLDDLDKVLAVDKKRVCATGMSNGAIMSYRLAAEMADRIAAIAPVAGPMGTATCAPSQPVPICHLHGTDDAFAPFKGGQGDRSLTQTNFFSVDHSIQAWVNASGCRTKPQVKRLSREVEDRTTVTRTVYSGGKQNSEVILYTIEGMGHTWPGQPSRLRFLGTTTKNIFANDVMWEFFERHARR
jgi:polyhydroxybutyrate depolymerase